jgi:hypothetical protein
MRFINFSRIPPRDRQRDVYTHDIGGEVREFRSEIMPHFTLFQFVSEYGSRPKN